MKKEMSILLLLMMISFASAQGLSDLLNQIDESTVILYAIFIVSFSVLFFSLNKVFKDNRTMAGVVSAVISFLIVYGVNKTGFDFQGFFFDIGISEEILMTIVPLIILVGAVFLIIKLKLASMYVFGVLLIASSFFVYEKTFLISLGIIFILIGFFVTLGTKKK